MAMSAQYYGDAHVQGMTQVFGSGFYLGTVAFAVIGGIGGALIASRLLRKHFEKAVIV